MFILLLTITLTTSPSSFIFTSTSSSLTLTLSRTASPPTLSTSSSSTPTFTFSGYSSFSGIYLPLNYTGYFFPVNTTSSSITPPGTITSCEVSTQRTSATCTMTPSQASLTVDAWTSNTFRVNFTLPSSLVPKDDLRWWSFHYPMTHISASLTPTELIYGSGQRYEGSMIRGRRLTNFVSDGSWQFLGLPFRLPVNDASYVPVPWFLSERGYGLLLNSTALAHFDLESASSLDMSVGDRTASLVVFAGTPASSPARILSNFTSWRGLSLIPPIWTFAPWKQTGNTLPNTTGTAVADLLVARDVPTSCAQTFTHWFPKGAQIGHEASLRADNDAYHGLGMKVTTYFNPYVSTEYAGTGENSFASLSARQLFIHNSTNQTYLFNYDGDFIQKSRHFFVSELDFTNPRASAWYGDQLVAALDLGYSGAMYDYGEYTPVDSVFANGRTGFHMRNLYPDLYDRAAYDALTELPQFRAQVANGHAPDFVYYTRSGYTHSGANAWAHWTGDASATFSTLSGLPAQISACLSAGLSGVAYCGADMNGYVCILSTPTTPELLQRWVAAGTFFGIMRDETTGTGCGHNRTHIFTSNTTLFVWRKYAKLRTALVPYTYTAAARARTTGLPLMRHHVLSFPRDRTALLQEYQFMFGDAILAAPVVSSGVASMQVYLPEGASWIDVGSHVAFDSPTGRFRIAFSDTLPGGRNVTVACPLGSLPWFVRAGSIVPTLDPSVFTVASTNTTDPRVVTMAQRADILHLWVWPDLAQHEWVASSGALHDGSSFALERTGGALTMQVYDSTSRYIVTQLPLAAAPIKVSIGGTSNTPVSTWRQVADYSLRHQGPAWTYDKTQRVLWVRALTKSQQEMSLFSVSIAVK